MKRGYKIYTVKVNSFVPMTNNTAKPIKIQMKMSSNQLLNYLKYLEETKLLNQIKKEKEEELYVGIEN